MVRGIRSAARRDGRREFSAGVGRVDCRARNDTITVVGQASGAYKSYDVLGTQVASASVHMFTAGPQWSRRLPNGVKAFGQAQAGLAVGRATAFGASDSSAALAIVPGGGADLPFMKNFDLRIGAEVPFVRDDGWWKGFRFMTGIVVSR
jgi:hypothetical protein